MYYIPAIFLIITILISLFLGILVIRSSRKEHDKLYLVINLSIILWALGDLLMLYSGNYNIVYNFALLFYIAPLFTPILLLLFSLAFPNGLKIKFLYPVGILIFGLLTYLVFNRQLFISYIDVSTKLNTIVPNKDIFIYYGLALILFFVLTYISFVIRIINSKQILRKQLVYILIGVFVSSSIALFTNVLKPLNGFYDSVWIGPPSTIFAAVTLAIAIIKYRVFEVKATVVRALGYVVFAFFVSITYVLLFIIVSTYLFAGVSVTRESLYISTLVTLLVTFTFGPLRSSVNRYTDRIFFRDKYDPQSIINNINLSLVGSKNLENILVQNITIIEKDIKLEYADYYLDKAALVESHIYGKNVQLFSSPEWDRLIEIFDKIDVKSIFVSNDKNASYNKYLNDLRIGCLVKMITDSKIVGYLVLGAKKNGTNFNIRDIQLFEIIADETAIAVQSHLRLKEIERFNETLQQNVKKATTDLQKSNEKLKSLDEAKDEFISMASHQLRTPLTSVKGYISMLLEGDAGPINDQQKTFLSQAFTSSQRMVYLIADLLNVSRLKTGKFIIEPSEVDLPQVVQTEVEQLQTTAAARGLTLKVDCPKDFPTLMLDETKIHQVIMNYIDNAIYYTPNGGSISVVLNVTKKTAELRVIDTGIGVPKKSQHELFTKFFRADNAQKARPDGTGLGLYMAKKVIIAQGGSVIFSSTQDKGSTFGFSFALNKVLPNTTDLPK